MNDHVNPIFRSALATVLPKASATDKHAIWMNLHGALEALQAEEWDLIARKHDVEEQMDRIQGRDLWAEFHRLSAEAARNRTPESKEIAHRAFIVALADGNLRDGRPPADDEYAYEVAQEMDRIKGAA